MNYIARMREKQVAAKPIPKPLPPQKPPQQPLQEVSVEWIHAKLKEYAAQAGFDVVVICCAK